MEFIFACAFCFAADYLAVKMHALYKAPAPHLPGLGAATGTTITVETLGSKTPWGVLSIADNATGKRFFYCLPDVEECLKNEEETARNVRAAMDKRNLRR